jgi:hypothetical protein
MTVLESGLSPDRSLSLLSQSFNVDGHDKVYRDKTIVMNMEDSVGTSFTVKRRLPLKKRASKAK